MITSSCTTITFTRWLGDVQYSSAFGFTEDEVLDILRAANILSKKEECKEWYDGYLFGRDTSVYCPWDIICHVHNLSIDPSSSPKSYWENTSKNSILKTILKEKNGIYDLPMNRYYVGAYLKKKL